MIPYLNNEHISNVYQIYNPYKGAAANTNVLSVNKMKYEIKGYNKNQKYSEYKTNAGQKKENLDSSVNYGSHSGGKKVVPNRKLSPIGKKLIQI